MKHNIFLFITICLMFMLFSCGYQGIDNSLDDHDSKPSKVILFAINADFDDYDVPVSDINYTIPTQDGVLEQGEYLIRCYDSMSSDTPFIRNNTYYNPPFEYVLSTGIYDFSRMHPSGAVVRGIVDLRRSSAVNLNPISTAKAVMIDLLIVNEPDTPVYIYTDLSVDSIAFYIDDFVYQINGDTNVDISVGLEADTYLNILGDEHKYNIANLLANDTTLSCTFITSDTNRFYALMAKAFEKAVSCSPFIDYSTQYIDTEYLKIGISKAIGYYASARFENVLADAIYANITDTTVHGLEDDTAAANALADTIAKILFDWNITDTEVGSFTEVGPFTDIAIGDDTFIATMNDTFQEQVLESNVDIWKEFLVALRGETYVLYRTFGDSLSVYGCTIAIESDTAIYLYNYNTGSLKQISIDDCFDTYGELKIVYTEITDANLSLSLNMIGLDQGKPTVRNIIEEKVQILMAENDD